MIDWFRTAGLRLLLAVGLAFSLWVYVSFRENPNVTSPFQGVPVETEGLSPGLVVVDQSGLPATARQTVTISAEGPENAIQGLRPSDIRAFADLSGFGEGEYQVPVAVSTARTGFARVSFSTDPAFLPFRIEQSITRTVALTVELQGSVPFSFEQLAPQTSVNNQRLTTVDINGPENRVNQVDHVRATANINQLTANYNSPRPLEAVDADGMVVGGVVISPSNIDVLVPIVSSVGIKRVPIVPQVVGRPANGLVVSNVSVSPEFVTLTGSSGPLDAVRNIGTEALDLAGASGTFTRTVELRPPPGVTLLETEPTSVVVEVTTRPIAQAFSVSLPAEIVPANQPAGLLLSINPNVVQVELSGNAGAIAAIGNSPIRGTVDLNNLNAGTYTLTPSFNLPNGVTLANPPSVSVTLRVPPTVVPPTVEPTTTPAVPAEAPTNEPAAPTATPAPSPAPAPDATAVPSSADNQQPTATP